MEASVEASEEASEGAHSGWMDSAGGERGQVKLDVHGGPGKKRNRAALGDAGFRHGALTARALAPRTGLRDAHLPRRFR